MNKLSTYAAIATTVLAILLLLQNLLRATEVKPVCQSTGKSDKEHYNALLGVLSHSARNKDGVSGRERRDGVRESWMRWSEANHDVKIVFVMDETEDKEVLRESHEYGDIIFLETKESGQAVKFGEKWISWVLYATSHYTFDWLGRIDDDTFVCLDRLMFELRNRASERLVWGWWFVPNPWSIAPHSIPDNPSDPMLNSSTMRNWCSGLTPSNMIQKSIRPDEMFMIVSGDLVRFWANSTDILLAHRAGDLMDVTLITWLYPLHFTSLIDNRRIVRTSSFSPPNYGSNSFPPHSDSFCEYFLVAHKTHPEVMKSLHGSNLQKVFSYEIPSILPECRH